MTMRATISRVLVALVLSGVSMDVYARLYDSYISGTEVEPGERYAIAIDGRGDGEWQVDVSMHPNGNREGRRTSVDMTLTGATDTLTVAMRWYNSNFGEFDDRRLLRVDITRGGTTVLSRELQPGGGNDQNVSVWLRSTEDGVDAYSGNFRRQYLGRFMADGFRPDSLTIQSDRAVTVNYVYVASERSAYESLQTSWTSDELIERCRHSDDHMEAVWQYLDRENDPSLARQGGAYIVATVRNEGTGGYDIIYLSGAQTYAGRWRAGMVKGRLLPTLFSSNFDLEWYDSACEPTEDPYSSIRDNNADVRDNTMTLHFPLLEAQMRLVRVPREKLQTISRVGRVVSED